MNADLFLVLTLVSLVPLVFFFDRLTRTRVALVGGTLVPLDDSRITRLALDLRLAMSATDEPIPSTGASSDENTSTSTDATIEDEDTSGNPDERFTVDPYAAPADVPSIYVESLDPFGSKYGRWIACTLDVDSIREAIDVVLGMSESDEYVIADYSGFAGAPITPFESIERVHAIALLVEDEGHAAGEWIAYDSSNAADVETLHERFTDEYVGHYSDGSAFAMELADEYGSRSVITAIGSADDLPECVSAYLDWSAIGRDLLIDSFYDMDSSAGIYVFRRI